jgi:hypothetical protein
MTMLTLELPLETQTKLEERATKRGQDVQTYVLSLIHRDIDVPTLRELFASVRAQIQASGVSDEELEIELDTALSEVRQGRRA